MQNRIIKTLFVIIFVVSFLFSSVTVQSKPFVEVNDTTGKYILGKSIKYLEDKDGLLTIDDIVSIDTKSRFIQNTTSVPNFGFSESTYWLTGELKYSGKNEKKTFILEITYPLLDFIDLYIPDKNGSFVKRSTGDHFCFSHREIANNTFAFKIELHQHQPKKFFLKINTSSSIQVPMILWCELDYTEHIIVEKFAYGIFFGMMMIMIGYNFILFLIINDINVLYYLLFIIFHALFQASLTGYSFQFLWNDSPWWGNKALPFFILITATSAYQFSTKFLNTEKYIPLLRKIIFILIVIGMVTSLLTFNLSYGISIKLATAYALLWSMILLTSGIVSLYRGNQAARFYLFAWIAFLSAVFIYSLKSFGFVSSNFVTEHAIQFGFVNLITLLSIAMVDKVNIERHDSEIKQQQELNKSSELLDTQRQIRVRQEMIAKKIQTDAVTVLDVSEKLLQDTTILSEQSDNVAKKSDLISASIFQISTAIENIKIPVDHILKDARDLFSTMNTVYLCINVMSETMDTIEQNTKDGVDIAMQANQLSNKTKQTMSDLETAANKINSVNDLIRQISDKTTLLSLNAAIEAASAGEAGKGFSIVARFIQTFAGDIADAANDIGRSIFEIQNKTQDSINFIVDIISIIEIIHDSSETIFKTIEEHVKKAHTIASNTVEVRSTSEKILSLIGELSREIQLISQHSDNISKGVNEVALLTKNVSLTMNDNKQSIAFIRHAFKYLSELSGKMIEIDRKVK